MALPRPNLGRDYDTAANSRYYLNMGYSLLHEMEAVTAERLSKAIAISTVSTTLPWRTLNPADWNACQR
jgi:hypothetical protein